MRKSFLFLAVFFISILAWSQNLPENYRRAQVQLNSGSYWEAMNSFKEFVSVEKFGNLANYAAFHGAQAALGANQPNQAIDFLEPLTSRNWDKGEEAKYLLATAYFQNSQALQGLKEVSQLQNEEIKRKAQNLIYEFLIKQSPDFLIRNLREFQELSGYTAALSTVLNSKSVLSSEERALYYELQGIGELSGSSKIKDEVLDIVVILPFTDGRSGEISPSSFTYELFEGIRFGVNQLKREGKRVNLISFDSKRDLNHLQNILKEPAVKRADVIVGPIYLEESDLVSAFAENAKIPFIHPLSNLGERFQDKQYSYLFRPSAENIVDGIIQNLKSQRWGKRVAIGYSNSSRDEKMNAFLKEKLTKEGFRIVDSQPLNPRNAASFLADLGVRPGRDSANLKVDQVIMLTDDPAIAQSTLSLIESVTTSLPILVMDSWLGFNFANFEMLEDPNFYFISNNSPALDKEAMIAFKTDFYNRNLVFPSMNAVLGKELIFWLSSNLSPSFGFDLRRSLNQQQFQQGNITWGFNFLNSNSNNYVPVFGFEYGELKPLTNQ